MLNPSDIAAPLRSVLRRAANVSVLLAEVERVDLAARRLVLDRGEIGYEALVLAAGASHSYFGHEDWGVFAPGLKTLEDALEIRRRVLLAYEAAERELDTHVRLAMMDNATEALLRDLEASPTDLRKLVVSELGRNRSAIAIESEAIARWERDDPQRWASVRAWLLARGITITVVRSR